MKKRKLLCLVGATLACVALGVACDDGESSANKNTTVSFLGVKELHLKVGEASEERLLRDVLVSLPNGTTKKPVITSAEPIDYTKAGDYAFSYEYEGQKINTALYLYAMPQVYLDGTAVTGDTLTLSYRQANESFDFIKGVQVKDSFGTVLEMKKTQESESYDGLLGEYTVTYTATDKAGNALNKQITYVVESNKMPEIEDYDYEIGGVYEVPLNAYGEKTGWLYNSDGALVPTEYFTLTQTGLKFEQKYLLNLGEGTHEFLLKTLEGYADFSLTVEDKGKPVFEVSEIKTQYNYGEIRIQLPTPLWFAHDGYTYEYTLSGTNGFMLAEEKEDNILLLTPTGDDLTAGSYTLSVTATSANGEKTTTMDYGFSVNEKADPNITAGEKSSFVKTAFNDEEVYAWTKADGSNAWEGRLGFAIPASRYIAMTFDLYVAESTQVITEGNKANIRLRGATGSYAYNYAEINHTEGIMDKTTGAYVAIDDIEVGKWYTAMFKLDKCTKADSGYLYMQAQGTDDKVGATVYMKNITFHDKGGVDLLASGKSAFTPALLNESTYGTNVAYKYTNSGYSSWDGRFETKYQKTERAQIEYDVYIESTSTAVGTKANANLQVVSSACNNMIDQNFGIVDKATGKYIATADMQLGKWYTVTATTHIISASATVYFYFADKANIVAYFKDFKYVEKINYDGPKITVSNANARAGFKKIDTSAITALGVDRAWEYNKLATMPGYDARLQFKHDGVSQTLTFDLYIAESSKAESGKANVGVSGSDGTYYNKFTKIVEKGKTATVAQADIQIGKWYTVTYNLAGLAKDKTCYIFFDTYGAEGGIAVKAYFANFNYA